MGVEIPSIPFFPLVSSCSQLNSEEGIFPLDIIIMSKTLLTFWGFFPQFIVVISAVGMQQYWVKC